ncbi:MAG: hypothetical protein H6P94_802 [Thermoplasmatales archaeon]|jgi:hypothetical protein|nr:hypothetical protein [Thermoplasmatales archaeon]
MKKQENIYVSLQLEKDVTTGELMIAIQFDRNSPNFFTNKNMISWCPTREELEFINDAYGAFHKGKHQHQDSLQKPSMQEREPEELIRDTDEKEILNRVFEKKRPGMTP